MKIKSLKNAKDIIGKRVFLRSDFNVPIKNGKVREDYKIATALPTIRFLIRHNCKIVISTHLGDPKGKFDKKYSVEPIVERLSKLLGKQVAYVPSVIGLDVGTRVSKMKEGEILMIENLRFEAGEEKNDKKFAQELAKLADFYVNNAFAVCHRAHASVSAIKSYLPSYAGLLLEDEVENLHKVIAPVKPMILVMGGSKITTKVPLIKRLSKKSFKVLVGGALANNFLAAKGYEVGQSLIDGDSVKFAKSFKISNLILPVDAVVRNKKTAKVTVKKVDQIIKDDVILDIGPETISLFSSFIKKANTIIWNGPMGMYESAKFKHGTLAVARVIASRSRGKAFGLVGGGETIDALNQSKMQDYIDWASTAGGAMLSYLGGEDMPGLKGIIR